MIKPFLKMHPERLFISGFMATGKSTVGSELAKKLGLPFQDLDGYLERKEDKTIKNIFTDEGEDYFRQKEREYLQHLAASFRGVLALGGGSLQTHELTQYLKEMGILIYIETPIEIVVDRICNNTNRPMALDENGRLKTREILLKELNSLYIKRKDLYEKAHIKVICEKDDSSSLVVDEIIEKLKEYVPED